MILKAVQLSKRFGTQKIIENFDQEFTEGKLYAITGPNGSGKSTLLKILSGSIPPSKGEVQYQDQNGPVSIDQWYKLMSISAPYMDVVEDLTLEELIGFQAKFKSQIENSELIHNLDFQGLNNKMVRDFSSGMKQKLKLGLCFFSDSPILFLDEPCTNLDTKGIEWYQAQLQQNRQKLILVFSNRPEEYPNADQIISLK